MMNTQPATRTDPIQAEISARIHLMNPPLDFTEEVKRALTFPNPKYLEAERMGRWTGNIPRYLVAYESTRNGLPIPRGFGPRLLAMADYCGLEVTFQDQTRVLPEVDFHFKGTLRPFQEEAVKDILSRPMGTLAAPTGSGKTIIALGVIAERRQPALVVVHTKEL